MEASLRNQPSRPHRSAEVIQDPLEEIRYILDRDEFLGANPFAHPTGNFISSEDSDFELNFKSAEEALQAGIDFFRYGELILKSFKSTSTPERYKDIMEMFLSLKERWQPILFALASRKLGVSEDLDHLVDDTRQLMVLIAQDLELGDPNIEIETNEGLASQIRKRLKGKLN